MLLIPFRQKKGCLFYKVVFFQRTAAAEIKVTDIPGEKKPFEFRIHKNGYWARLPERFYNVSSKDLDILTELEIPVGLFETKNEAFQTAEDIIKKLLNQYRYK